MVEPIPDEVLADFADKGRVWFCVDMDGSSKGKPFSSAIWGQDLARELLALRAAARVADNVLLGVELGEVVGEKAAMRARADLRALLPEEPPRA